MAATTLAYLPKIPAVLLTTYLIDRLGRRAHALTLTLFQTLTLTLTLTLTRRALLSAFTPIMALCLLALAAATGWP